jgi:mono/diheme cytochrome c family protein
MNIRAATFVLLASLAVIGALLPACDAPLPEVGYEGYDACSDEAHRGEDYFTEVMVPDFFQPYCAYCHWSDLEDRRGGTVGLDFDMFERARSRNALVWARVASREMPPMARTPSTEELELLVDWLNCTAPEPSTLPQNLAAECPDGTLTFAVADADLLYNWLSCGGVD